jgi:hypothetical protein
MLCWILKLFDIKKRPSTLREKQIQSWRRRFKNVKFRVNFENVFLEKYLHDFRYKNMIRISMALTFDFT